MWTDKCRTHLAAKYLWLWFLTECACLSSVSLTHIINQSLNWKERTFESNSASACAKIIPVIRLEAAGDELSWQISCLKILVYNGEAMLKCKTAREVFVWTRWLWRDDFACDAFWLTCHHRCQMVFIKGQWNTWTNLCLFYSILGPCQSPEHTVCNGTRGKMLVFKIRSLLVFVLSLRK